MVEPGRSAHRSALLPALALMFNALVWGVSWWPFRQLEARGLHPLWSTALIYLVALVCLIAVRPGAWRGFGRHPLLWLLLVSSGLTNVGFNWAVTEGDVIRVVLLFYLMPAWSVLLAWPLLGERPTGGALLRLLLALVGVGLVLQADQAGWPWPRALPDWLALMGGLTFALTNILLLKLNASPSPSRMLAMFGGGAFMATGVALLGTHQGLVGTLPAPAVGWLWMAGLLSLCFLVGNLALQYGAARLSAHTTALIMLSEVVFASVSSVVLGAASLTLQTVAGGSLILLAAVLASRAPSRPHT